MGKTQVGYFICISSLTNAAIIITSTTTIYSICKMIEYCNNYHIRVYKILPRIMISHSRLSVHVRTAKIKLLK